MKKEDLTLPFINVINENEATDELKNLYDKIKSTRGKLSNIMKIHSLMPETMIKHLELYTAIMFSKTNLSREEKEILAVVVSKSNNCAYCVRHHSKALNHYWKNEERLIRFTEILDDQKLTEKFRLVIKHAIKLTTEPAGVKETDIEELKSYGWTDEDILAINLIISYFNFVNRIANGLGVESTEDEVKGYKY
jgi:uncharacterized peroxidase-related enzyme